MEELLKEALQRALDQWSDGKYSLDIEIRGKEVHSRNNPSEVIEVIPELVYMVSCAGMTYELKEALLELSSTHSGTISVGQDSNQEHWRLVFPSARRLYYEASAYFKEEAFKKLLDE